ncbi:MAG: SusC/RagA family TonB-linked outer membrane protein [Chitinophagales bacterium]
MKRLVLLITLLLPAMILLAQRTVKGKVTDESGNPVPHASVTIKETQQGGTADADGNFSIAVDNRARTLVFSFVGKASQEVTIGNKSTINITLKQEDATMSEVVVVAYGTQSKQKITGSVAKVGGTEVENRPFTSVDQLLQGKVAGLQSTSPTGQPGGIQQVRIRGIGSITAGAAPLYVVDGVILNTGDFSRLNNTSNALAGINPNDIESISVLKDAAASAIYGARASNGVVLITTKKGKAGKSKIRVDSEYGFGSTAIFNDLARPLNATDYFNLTNEGLVNAGATQAQITSIMASLGYNNGYDEDWLKRVTQSGVTQDVNASVSGGDNKTTFYTSAGYFYQKAVVIGSDFKRYSGTVNVRHKASDKLTVGLNASGTYYHQNSPFQSSNFRNPVIDGYLLRPSQNAFNSDGTVNISTTTFNQLYNPVGINQYDRTYLDNTKILTNVSGEYQLCKDLKFTTKFGIDYFDIEEFNYYNPFFGDARTTGGRESNFDTRVSNWISTNQFNYHHNFLKSKDLGVDFLAAYEAQKSKQLNISATGTSVPTTTAIPLPVPSSPSTASGARGDYSFTSILSQLQLNYKTRYSLSGSFRRDGSSRFGTDVKYGNFWSVGGAWNLDQENFMKSVTFINALKLRGSYGKLGNADIGNYPWQGTYTFSSPYNQLPGSAPNQIQNDQLTWEVNKPFDVGIDVTVWKNRVTLTAEYYNRKSTSLILAQPLSPTSGFASVNANIGSMTNKGWEFQLNATPVRTKDFSWDVAFNIALNKNKITSLANNNADILALPFLRRVGQDFQTIYTRLWAGVDPATGNPLWYTDSSKTQTTSNVTTVQRGIIGSASPKGFGSLSTTLSYKGFSLDAQFNYQYGNLVYDQWGFLSWSDGYNPSLNKIQKQLTRWQKPGDITDVPKYVYGGAMNSNAESSRWYYKGNFIRLRDLTLSYTVPKKITDAAKLDNVHFYIRGSNLWTKAFDKNITFDPEQAINGVNDLQVLIQRTVSIGLTLGF